MKARNHDGGYGISPSAPSTPEMTGWAMLGLEAAGRNPLDVGRRHRTPVAYLRKRVENLDSTGDLERTILALHGAGVDARDFEGRDLVTKLRKRRRHNGSWSGQVNLTAFGILAMRTVGKPPSAVKKSRRWLQRAHNHNGGWGFQAGVASDADSTGAALQALAAASAGKRVLRKGAHYLSHTQHHGGGWPVGGGGPSNAQSTAWAVQGIIAAGRDPAAIRAGGRSGLDYLVARRAGNGHYRYSASSDQTPVWVTGQALMAAEREALPVAAVPRAQAQGGGTNGSGSGGTAAAAPARHQLLLVPERRGDAATEHLERDPLVFAHGGRSSSSGGGGSGKQQEAKKRIRRGTSNGAAGDDGPPRGEAVPGHPKLRRQAARWTPSPQSSGNPTTARRARPAASDGTPVWVYVAAGAASARPARRGRRLVVSQGRLGAAACRTSVRRRGTRIRIRPSSVRS